MSLLLILHLGWTTTCRQVAVDYAPDRSAVGRRNESCWKFGGVHPLRDEAIQRMGLVSPAEEHSMATELLASRRTREELDGVDR